MLNDISFSDPPSERKDGLTGIVHLGPEIESGSPAALPPGPYIAKVLYLLPRLEKYRIEVVFDIVAGLHAGFFAELPASRDWQHTLYLGLKPNNLRFTQLAIKAISEANPGFDGFEAWNHDLREFEGKLVPIIASHRETLDNYGEAETLCSFRAVSPAALKAGRYLVPGTQHVDGTRDPNVTGQPIDVDALLAEARGEEEPGQEPVGRKPSAGGEAQQDPSFAPNPLWGGDVDA